MHSRFRHAADLVLAIGTARRALDEFYRQLDNGRLLIVEHDIWSPETDQKSVHGMASAKSAPHTICRQQECITSSHRRTG